MALLPTFCGKDCGGNACPLTAVVEDGRVRRVRYNAAGGRYIRGCPRGLGLPSETYAADRILTPLVRTGPRGSGQFREAGWDEALAITARNLEEIRAKYGPVRGDVLLRLGVIGALHGTRSLLMRFMNLFGGSTRLTSNYSNGAVLFVLPYLLGSDWDPLRLRRGDDAAFPDDRALGGERPRNPHGRGDGPAADRSRQAGNPDRGDRAAPLLHGRTDRRLVDPLPARNRRGPDAGRAPRADHGESRRPGIHRRALYGVRPARTVRPRDRRAAGREHRRGPRGSAAPPRRRSCGSPAPTRRRSPPCFSRAIRSSGSSPGRSRTG